MSNAVTPWDRLPEPAIALERTFEGFLDLDWLELERDFVHVQFRVRDNLKQPLGLLHGGIYAGVAETIASIAPSLDRFFVDVLVNCPEEDLKRNRLALLASIQKEFTSLADFSEIVVEK